VEIYENEDEQLEALKKWWNENGKSIIGGLVLGLAGVLGWQAWQSWQTTRGEEGAQQFDQLTLALGNNAVDVASGQAAQLMKNYEGDVYGVFAAWAMARQSIIQGDMDGAATRLQWAMEKSPSESLKVISQLRLARVLLAAGKFDEAAKWAKNSTGNAFAAEFSLLSGDIELARGDHQLARQAYQRALNEGVQDKNLVEMKLNDLGSADSAALMDAS